MRTASPRLAAGSLLAGAGLIAAATLAARAAGLGRWFVFSHSVGATCIGQVYATTNVVPNVLFEVAAGGALAAVVVPLVAGHLHRGDEQAADRTASALLTWAVALLLPIAVLVALLAEPVAGALLGAASCEQPSATATGALMLALFAPQVVLYGIGIVLSGVLQAHRRFLAAAMAPLLSSLVAIATYLAYGRMVAPGTPLGIAPRDAIVLLAGGTTLGVVALSLPLLVPAWRTGVRLRPTVRFPAGTGRRAGTLAAAGLLAVGAQQVCVLATAWLSNRADGTAAMPVYTYVQTVYLLPYAVLVIPLATAAFPRLADPEHGARTLARTASAVLVAAVGAAVALVAVRREVGALFLALDAGSAGEGRAALESLPMALAAYAPGVAGFGLAALFTRALYVRGAPLRAALAVAGGWAVATLLPLVLLLSGGPATVGRTLVVLGLGSAAGMTITALAQLRQVRRAWGSGVLDGLGRVGVAAGVGALLVLGVREAMAPWWHPEGALPAVLAGGLTGLLVLTAVLMAVRMVAPATYGDLLGGIGRRGGTLRR
ncbi:lipid II flippase MurJ [soil metagenome]